MSTEMETIKWTSYLAAAIAMSKGHGNFPCAVSPKKSNSINRNPGAHQNFILNPANSLLDVNRAIQTLT